MNRKKQIAIAALALLLGSAAQAYERELTPRQIREAYYLGNDTTFRSKEFFQGYVRTFPRPAQGPYVVRIEMVTPFKAVVDRTRRAPGSYSPLRAGADYRQQPPRVVVKVRLELTPTYPAHSPYHFPIHLGPIYLRDPDFWKEFEFHVVQRGEVTPAYTGGDPFYSCSGWGGCWLAGAEVTLVFDPNQVASEPTRVIVLTPDGQQVQAEFDLAKLR